MVDILLVLYHLFLHLPFFLFYCCTASSVSCCPQSKERVIAFFSISRSLSAYTSHQKRISFSYNNQESIKKKRKMKTLVLRLTGWAVVSIYIVLENVMPLTSKFICSAYFGHLSSHISASHLLEGDFLGSQTLKTVFNSDFSGRP